MSSPPAEVAPQKPPARHLLPFYTWRVLTVQPQLGVFLVSFIALLPFILFLHTVDPPRRRISLLDASLMNSAVYGEDVSPSNMLQLALLWLYWLLSFIAIEWLTYLPSRRLLLGKAALVARVVHWAMNAFLAFAFGILAQQASTALIGAPRPNFLLACNPWPQVPGGRENVTAYAGLTFDPDEICTFVSKDMFRSFVSGHASAPFSMAAHAVVYQLFAVFLRGELSLHRFYFARETQLPPPALARGAGVSVPHSHWTWRIFLGRQLFVACFFLWQMFGVCGALYIAASRIVVVRHSPADITAGVVVGMIFGVFGAIWGALLERSDLGVDRQRLLTSPDAPLDLSMLSHEEYLAGDAKPRKTVSPAERRDSSSGSETDLQPAEAAPDELSLVRGGLRGSINAVNPRN